MNWVKLFTKESISEFLTNPCAVNLYKLPWLPNWIESYFLSISLQEKNPVSSPSANPMMRIVVFANIALLVLRSEEAALHISDIRSYISYHGCPIELELIFLLLVYKKKTIGVNSSSANPWMRKVVFANIA